MALSQNDPFNLYSVLAKHVNQEAIIEESSICQLLRAVHGNDLDGVIKAIENGARLNDRGFNALDYALQIYQSKKQRELAKWDDYDGFYAFRDQIREYEYISIDGYINICHFLITNHAELVTQRGAKKLLEMDNKLISKILVDTLAKDQS